MTTFRRATEADVPAIAELLRDDVLGARREGDDMAPYLTAFAAVDADPAHYLVVAESEDGAVVGTLQATLLPGLARGGATRLQLEAVRVAVVGRGSGLGAELLEHAHEWGRERGATLAQLTSDGVRGDAHRFYEANGYRATHLGFKRDL